MGTRTEIQPAGRSASQRPDMTGLASAAITVTRLLKAIGQTRHRNHGRHLSCSRQVGIRCHTSGAPRQQASRSAPPILGFALGPQSASASALEPPWVS